MKNSIVLIVALALSAASYSQKMLWTSQNGGSNGNGAVIQYDLSNQQTEVLASLSGNFLKGISIQQNENWYFNAETFNTGGLVSGGNGLIYGVSNTIGFDAHESFGGLYSIDPSTDETQLIHFFSGPRIANHNSSNVAYQAFNQGIHNPVLGIIQVGDYLYGICDKGGADDKGGIYRYNLSTNNYEKVIDFDTQGFLGYHPNSPLVIGPNGDLYGVLKYKGSNAEGHLYKVDVTNNTVSVISPLGAAGWAIADPVMAIAYNPSLNMIFGTKETFSGLNAGGGVWSYNFNNGLVTNETIITTGQTATLGDLGNGMTPVAPDGNHYFTTRAGGGQNDGTLVRYNPGTNTMTKVHDFVHPPSGTGFIINGTKIYGTYSGIAPGQPLIWSYDVSTLIFSEELSASANSTIGACIMNEIAIVNNELYAHTIRGIESDVGSLFKLNLISSQLSVVQNNQSVEGRGLIGEITLVDDTSAYTYIGTGGQEVNPSEYSEQGGIAKINLIGGTVEYDLLKSDYFTVDPRAKSSKYNKILKSNSGNLYSSTYVQTETGSARNRLYKIDASNNYSIVWEASEDREKYNFSGLEYQNGEIAFVSGDSIHIYNESNNALTSYDLGLDGVNTKELALNQLTLASNGVLYFTTYNTLLAGGTCSVYAINTLNWSVTQVHEFTTDAQELNNGLVEYNGKLYGSAIAGGANNEGFLYSIELSTGNFSIEYDFDADVDGGAFLGGWTLYNNELYAVSYTGGQNGYGTFVKFNPTNSTLTVIEDLTMTNGRAYRSTPAFWDDSFIGINEIAQESKLSLYPNPTTGLLHSNLKSIDNCIVRSIDGSTVKSEVQGSTISITDNIPGVYFVTIQSKGVLYNSKIILK